MITEDYCSFEVAKLLKEKGFNVPCCRRYNGYSMITQSALYSTPFYQEEKVSAYILLPTHQMALKWLREVHGIDIIIEISDPSVKDRKYYCMIWDGNNNSYILDLFNSYEEAVEAALKYTLENLI